MVWIGLIWLRIGTSGGLLWTRKWNFGFHKIWKSWVTERQADSQEGLSSIELVIYLCGFRSRIGTLHLWIVCASSNLSQILIKINRCYYYYDSTDLRWGLAAFSVSWPYTQSVGLLGRGISLSQGLYLHTIQHKHRINAHNTDTHSLSGIRTHDPSVQANEDCPCLRPRGHCDRLKRDIFAGILW
jgi:hypothetical protein